MIDYIIVGSGLAGISFAEEVLLNNKTVLVFNDDSQNSSKIAGGLYNPVILKRFSEVWQAQEQLELMNKFYSNLGNRIDNKFDFKIPILRKFFSIEEQNNWFAASDKPALTPFLSTSLIFKNFGGINSPFGYGEVLQTGYVDTALLVSKYQEYLFSLDFLTLGNDLFKVGATYNWKDKTDLPTEEGRIELIDRIREIISCDFEIMEHYAGVRPTVRDRRPLVGTHHEHKRVHILNGLGTRGVMLGPAMAKALFNNIENDISLDKEIDIKRFTNKSKGKS